MASTARKRPVKKRPAKKGTSKKVATKRKKAFRSEGPLSPAQQQKALRKLRRLSLPPTHPSEITGPAMALGYDAPLPKKRTARKNASAKASRKRTAKKK